MQISLKQIYKQIGSDSRQLDGHDGMGHFKPEAFGLPLFHNRESVSELKKRFER